VTSRRQQTLILAAVLLFMAVSLALAYFIGTNRSPGAAAAPLVPVKKFRAKPGTERENARALLSSVPSVNEETTDDPLEVWGSLDQSDSSPENKSLILDIRDGVSPDDAIDTIERRLAALPLAGNDTERAELEAAMATWMLAQDPPDEEGAQRAFARAEELATTPDARVSVDRLRLRALLAQEDFEGILASTAPERYIDAPLSAARLEIELARGIAFGRLANPAEAEQVFTVAIDAAMDSHRVSPEIESIVRLLALHLGRLYREDGRDTNAIGLSRRLRAWLGEEELILR